MAMAYDNYAGAMAYGGQQSSWQYGYQQQDSWMYGQVNQQQQQQWMPQDAFYAQQVPMNPACSGASCLIDLDEYSDMSSSDSETEPPTASKASGKITSAKVVSDEPLQRSVSQVEPAAEPAPATLTEAKLQRPDCLNKELDIDERTETSSTLDTPASRFGSSGSEPEAELSSRNESDFSDTEIENQPGELFSGNAAELLRWRFAATGRNVLGYGAADASSASSSSSGAKYRAPARPSNPHAASSSTKGDRSKKTKNNNKRDKLSWGPPQGSTSAATTPAATRAVTKLEVSKNSWSAQQKERRNTAGSEEDSVEVLRTIKSILNKLTVEKFPQLSKKLVEETDFSTTEHVEFLISELFEKATTQHHFIDMYGDLCALLQDYFASHNNVVLDEKFSFKRLLLNECQRTFEHCLKSPTHKTESNQEERDNAERLYKDKMLGNIRFVGALLARNMLASKVLLAILEELLAEPTPEALESVAVLLGQIGPIFDTPQWTYHSVLKGYFKKVEAIVAKGEIPTRIRCLLKDVLDLRSTSWEDRKPKRLEGPMKLDEVAKKAAADKQQQGRSTVNSPKASNSPKAAPAQRTPLALKPPSSKKAVAVTTQFEEKSYRAEMQKTFAELRASHDAGEATARLSAAGVPPVARQTALLCDMLVIIVEEANASVRTAGFAAVAGLFLTGVWAAQGGLSEGVRSFLAEACEDLRLDVPGLSQILTKELRPEFLVPLKQKGLLMDADLEKYIQ